MLSPANKTRPCDYEMVVASILDPILVLSKSGVVDYANPAAEALLERSRALLEGRSALRVLDGSPWLVELIERAQVAPRTAVRGTGRIGGADGPQMSAVATTLHDRHGGAAGVVLVLHDAGRRSWMPNDKHSRERLDELNELVATVGHEINNPLSGIRGAAQILARKLTDRPDLADYGAMIVRQVDRIAELISKLMELESPPTSLEPVNVHRVLQDVVLLERSDADQRGVRVETEFDPSLPPVLGDPAQLGQVFLNLVKNAVAACPANRGIVRIVTRMEHSFYIDTKSGRVHYIAVEVSDNGPGLDPEQAERIFTPFYSGTEGGHGIGLSIARSIVTAHRGHIAVERSEAGGARFRVMLPVADVNEGSPS
ncbi:MAG: hypothetical protein D6760_08100 [Deltaproteobacteria bacterium]|nr:MAG: hypothetical protein D6760_08100 [Deltaproteobacteria bacterium]